jgi:uncharacterized protein YbcI
LIDRSGLVFFLPARDHEHSPRESEAGPLMSVGAEERRRSVLEDVSTALVRLHKEQFGRGPTRARTYFAGPEAMVCVLHDALLPAERKLVEMGESHRVTDTRTSFQAATRLEFTTAIEEILHRQVIAFASAVDPENNVVFENYVFAPVSDTDDPGAVSSEPGS